MLSLKHQKEEKCFHFLDLRGYACKLQKTQSTT